MTRPRSVPRPPRRTRRIVRIMVESLEGRALLSAIDTIVPAVASIIADQGWGDAGGRSSEGVTNPSPNGTAMKPAQILAAYGFSTSPKAGAGTTIAIVDAYNDPNIRADLAAFDAYYGLPAASLTVLNQDGETTNLPATDPSWSLEISLDVEWAHAVAPAAKIVLVEADSASLSDLMTAVQTAAQKSDVVSMSWGGGEFYGQQSFDTTAYFANPNATFVAASGDDGGAYGAEWPASSPYVLSVGGTALTLGKSGGYGRETAWNASWSWGSGGYSFSGSTGGVSQVESLPGYQAAALGSSYAAGRVVPDVSMDADPKTGVSVFDSVAGLSQSGWFKVGGTSAGSPIWSGLVADADQARAAARLAPLSSTQTLNMLYGLYGTRSSYASDFHDVKSGINFAGRATTGYDVVTGLGSPKAAAIINAAAQSASALATPSATAQAVIYVVYSGRARAHDQAEAAADRTASLLTAAEIRFVATALAALTPSPAPVEPPMPVHSTGTDVDATVAPGLPNQSVTPSADFEVIEADLLAATPTVYNGSDFVPGAPVGPMMIPGGDFLSPPILDPAIPIGVWDEALADVRDEVGQGSFEPQALVPWIGCNEAEEDLAEAAPSLLGTAMLAVVFGMGWNRALVEDDRRSRAFTIPSLSID